jgi:hypothetical protein
VLKDWADLSVVGTGQLPGQVREFFRKQLVVKFKVFPRLEVQRTVAKGIVSMRRYDMGKLVQ